MWGKELRLLVTIDLLKQDLIMWSLKLMQSWTTSDNDIRLSELWSRTFLLSSLSRCVLTVLHGVKWDTPAEMSGGQRAEWITQFKPPGGLDIHSSDLSHTWKRWNERIQLYITIQQMDLIQVRFENILSLMASPHKERLTKEKLVGQFPVFQGTGKLSERCHLQIDPSAKPVVQHTQGRARPTRVSSNSHPCIRTNAPGVKYGHH